MPAEIKKKRVSEKKGISQLFNKMSSGCLQNSQILSSIRVIFFLSMIFMSSMVSRNL